MSVITKSSLVVAVFLGMFVGSARAQESVIVKVPFPFMVQRDEMPAGRYEVKMEDGVLFVRRTDNGVGVFATTFRAGGADPAGNEPALVFTRRDSGSDYVLSQVWESSGDGLVVVEPPVRERHADARPIESTVVIAALR